MIQKLTQFMLGALAVLFMSTAALAGSTPPVVGSAASALPGPTWNGTTDDRAQWVTALASASNKHFLLPAGTSRIVLGSGQALTLPCDVIFEGRGQALTKISIEIADNNATALLQSCANVTFKNMTLELIPAAGNTAVLIRWSADGLTFIDTKLDGTIETVTGAKNHNSHGIGFPTSGTYSGLTLTRTEVTRFGYAFLKANTSTSTQQRIRVSESRFHDNYNEDISFNSPLGVIEDVVASDNRLYAPRYISTSDPRIAMGSAGGRAIKFVNNVIDGDFKDAIHLEESITDAFISGNSGKVNRNAITVLENNISGTRATPSAITITNNNFTYVGSGSEVGLTIVWDASGQSSLDKSQVKNNIMSGFPTGYDDGVLHGTFVERSGNIAVGGAIGFHVVRGGLEFHDNTSNGSTVGVQGVTASINRHTFINTPTLVTSDTTHGPFYSFDPIVIYTGVVPTSGGVYAGDMMRMFNSPRDRLEFSAVEVYLRADGGNTALDTVVRTYSPVRWAGADPANPTQTVDTLTSTKTFEFNPGSFAVSLSNHSGYLAALTSDSGNNGRTSTVELRFKGVAIRS